MRRYAKTAWKQKNVFAAAAYARRITTLPHQISAMQETPGIISSSHHLTHKCLKPGSRIPEAYE